jgi:cytosine/adenosine deaminase-related metal-dependent hydrolase
MRHIIISRATLVLPDEIRQSPLYLSDGRIAGTRPPRNAWERDLGDYLIFPGLINSHDHLYLNSVPPLPQTRPFRNSYAWIGAFQSHFADPEVTAAVGVASDRRCHHGGLKNVLGGATTVVHHDPWHASLDDRAFPVRLLRSFGWAHSLGLGLRMQPAVGLPPYGPPVVESFVATPADWPWIIHLAEGTDDLAAAELSMLEALGCVANNTVLVHGVGLTEANVDLVIQRGAGVIWCPTSNLAILGRTLDPRRLFDAGRLALGSDSRLTGARDLLEELRVAAAHSDLTPRELLRLVTTDACRVLRVPAVGGLQVGQYADLLLLRDRGGDPYRQLLDTSRSELCAVVRDGTPVIADPEFADWFAACGLETARVKLDGRSKLLAGMRRDVVDLEPGLELVSCHE